MKRSLNVFVPFVCLLFFALPVFAWQQKTWDSVMKEADGAADQKRYVEAENLYREALRLIGNKDKAAELTRVLTLLQLTKSLDAQKKAVEAETTLKGALETLLSYLDHNPPKNQIEASAGFLATAQAFEDAGDFYAAHGNVDEAENYYRLLIEMKIRQKESGEQGVHQAFQMSKRNNRLRNEAILASLTTFLGAGDPSAIYFKLGNLYFNHGKFPEAEKCFEEAVKITTPSPSAKEGGPETGDPNPVYLTNLGIALAAQSKWKPAETNLFQAVAIFQKRMDLNSEAARNAVSNYVLVLKKQGRAAEAEPFLHKLQTGESIEPPK